MTRVTNTTASDTHDEHGAGGTSNDTSMTSTTSATVLNASHQRILPNDLQYGGLAALLPDSMVVGQGDNHNSMGMTSPMDLNIPMTSAGMNRRENPNNSVMLGGMMDPDEDDSDGESMRGEKKAGRRKIQIAYIEDKSRRHITFSKRKAGIMKKVTSFLQRAILFCFFTFETNVGLRTFHLDWNTGVTFGCL